MLRFDGEARLGVETLWRIIVDGRVARTSEDHAQQFGLPSPIDAGEELCNAIGAKPIQASSYDSVTGDLTLEFEAGVRLEIIVTSAGYENWNLIKADGTQLIAVGGGEIVSYSSGAEQPGT